MAIESKELLQVRQLYAQLESPNWMARPGDWIWSRPDGNPQGFGPLSYDQPGLANLLWLTMDMGEPPLRYDATINGLYMLVIRHAHAAKLLGEPLTDVAGMLTLQQFHDALPAVPADGHSIERTYPLLKALAARRLSHA